MRSRSRPGGATASRFVLWDGAVAVRAVSGISVGVGLLVGIEMIVGSRVGAVVLEFVAAGTAAGGRMDVVLRVGVRDTAAVPLLQETASRAAPTARIANRTARRLEII